jgi:hypothetical protein
MAPTRSKLVATPITQYERRERKVSYKITDENFVGAESNAVTKRLKQSADTARAAAVKRRQREPSVEDDEEEDATSMNDLTKGPSVDRSVRVPSADRSVRVPSADRSVQVPSADRSVRVPNANRSIQVPSADRSVQHDDVEMLDNENFEVADSDDNDDHPDAVSKPAETAEKQRGE